LPSWTSWDARLPGQGHLGERGFGPPWWRAAVPVGNDQSGVVFEALSDPMRRRLLSPVAPHPETATELANETAASPGQRTHLSTSRSQRSSQVVLAPFEGSFAPLSARG
jgi:hypothetical protein